MGHTISARGVDVIKNKVEAVQQALIPKTQTEFRFFLGLASYYWSFVPKFVTIAKYLHDFVTFLSKEELKCKKWLIGQLWSMGYNETFVTLKKCFNFHS